MIISIHALRGEGDVHQKGQDPRCEISIHALRGEGDGQNAVDINARIGISIHALRGEGDRWKLLL